MPSIIRKSHQHTPTQHLIGQRAVEAIRRWESAGELTPAHIGWDSLDPSQEVDAEVAMAWDLHDLAEYTIID